MVCWEDNDDLSIREQDHRTKAQLKVFEDAWGVLRFCDREGERDGWNTCRVVAKRHFGSGGLGEWVGYRFEGGERAWTGLEERRGEERKGKRNGGIVSGRVERERARSLGP